MVAQLENQRKLKDAPAPVVTHVGECEHGDEYDVHSQRSGAHYRATVDNDGRVICLCPSRTRCYHAPHVALAHQRRLAVARTGEDIDQLVEQIKTLCGNEFMEAWEKDREIWELAKRIEIARRIEREQGAQRRAA